MVCGENDFGGNTLVYTPRFCPIDANGEDFMKFKNTAIVFSIFVFGFTVFVASSSFSTVRSSGVSALSTPTPKPSKVKTIREITFTDGEYDGQAVTKTDAEWKKVLTSDEFYIMRKEGTEKPYTGVLLKNKKKGTYHCAACGLALFSSAAKYESDTGWPSFFQPVFKNNVTEKSDKTLGEERTEIECSRCGSHLGHVFDDGPQPTGLRYCMNSVSLKFKAAR